MDMDRLLTLMLQFAIAVLLVYVIVTVVQAIA